MSSIRKFVSGMIVGGMLVSGVGYAASLMNIEVSTPLLHFIFNGKEIIPGKQEGQYYNGKYNVPSGFLYKGTTYVPLRFISESLEKKVAWDGNTHTIMISDRDLPPRVINDISKVPIEVQEWIERSKGMELAQRLNLEDSTYLLVTRGPKNTGGYTVSLSSVQEKKDEVVVTVTYAEPKGPATQVMTYPYVLAVMNKTEKLIRLIGKNDEFIPQLYGIDSIQPIAAQSTNIKLFEPKKNNDGIIMHGVTRVFEAVVQYEMLDSSGIRKVKGFTQAAVAGGDWGYFSFKIPYLELNTKQIRTLQLFTESPKDGTKEDIVPLNISPYAK